MRICNLSQSVIRQADRPPLWSKFLRLFAIVGAGLIFTSPASGAGLLIADGGFGGVLEIKQQDVRVTINNSIAVTQIDQVFLNTENRQVEALYTFPVPREASVSNFSMWINGKEMIGEVVEKERAREIYNSYKAKKRDPGLLEQVDYKQFEMRIFPIAAGAEQRIRIEYYQALDVDHDWATYVYPLATETKGGPADTKVRGRFSMTVDIKSEVPIKELKSESHADDFVVVSHAADYAQASMELTEGDFSRDIVMSVQMKRPRTGLDVVTSQPNGENGYFMMTLTPGDDLSDSIEPMDYVFLLDISGSMAKDEKLAISRNSMLAFIETLGPEDRFDCIAFNLAPVPLFKEFRKAELDQIETAKVFLDSQRARGGTVLQSALTAAYTYRDSDRPLNVVLLSDGMTDAGAQAELMQLINDRPSGVRVFAVGVGNEVNKPLLQQMTQQAGGLAAFVSTEDSFARQASLMRQKLVRPAIENVSVNFGNEVNVYDVEPNTSTNLFYGTPLRLLGRYGGGGMVSVTLSGQIQGSPWTQTVDIDLPTKDGGNSEIERMWASARVQRLLASEREGNGSTRDEIVRLCEGYSIVSIYASMLVLENDAEFKRWKIQQRNAVRISRDRGAVDAVRADLAKLRKATENAFDVGGEKLVAKKMTSIDTAKPPVSAPDVNRGVDLNIDFLGDPASDQNRRSGGGAGGGAIEPVTAVLCLAAAAWARRRRRTS